MAQLAKCWAPTDLNQGDHNASRSLVQLLVAPGRVGGLQQSALPVVLPHKQVLHCCQGKVLVRADICDTSRTQKSNLKPTGTGYTRECEEKDSSADWYKNMLSHSG